MSSIDFTRYPSRHIALKIAYFGWNYHGLASQDHDIDQRSFPTIESHLMAALLKTKLIPHFENVLHLQKTIRFSKCGRTDKGVSSFCQIFGLTIRSQSVSFTSSDYSPWEFKVLDPNFNAKNINSESQSDKIHSEEFDYVSILNRNLPKDIRVLGWSPVGHEFDARFSCSSRRYKYFFPAQNLNIHAMNLAAQKYIGSHDFRFF